MKSQNTSLWVVANSCVVYEEPWHCTKIGMWFAVFFTQIIAPIFFRYIIHTEVYLAVFSAFVNQLTGTEVRWA
jgi:hypothetical protein